MQHKWAEVIKAWLDGKHVQFRQTPPLAPTDLWLDFDDQHLSYFDNPAFEWRVKPIYKYRVASFSSGARGFITKYARTVSTTETHKDAEESHNFVEWLTDWVEYE